MSSKVGGIARAQVWGANLSYNHRRSRNHYFVMFANMDFMIIPGWFLPPEHNGIGFDCRIVSEHGENIKIEKGRYYHGNLTRIAPISIFTDMYMAK